MYGMNLRYLATVFVDAQSIIPTSRAMANIGSVLGEEYVVAAVVEQTSTGPQNRIGFSTPDHEFSVVLATNRLDFAKVSTNREGSNMGAFEDFCKESARLLPLVMKQIERKGSRLASAQEGILAERFQEQSGEVSSRLLRLPISFQKHPVTEWNWRAVGQIGREFGITEGSNTIVSVYRSDFDFGPTNAPLLQQRINATRMDIDLNTFANDTEQRFDQEGVSRFFLNSPQWHSDLITDVRQIIEGSTQ